MMRILLMMISLVWASIMFEFLIGKGWAPDSRQVEKDKCQFCLIYPVFLYLIDSNPLSKLRAATGVEFGTHNKQRNNIRWRLLIV